MYAQSVCLQTHKHARTHTDTHTPFAHQHFDSWSFDKSVSFSPTIDPLLHDPDEIRIIRSLMKQRPLAYEIPWQGLKNQCCGEFLGATREILAKLKLRIVSGWGF